MTDSKRLYFIPIISRAIRSDDPMRSMKAAFDEIRNLGKQEEFKEGFQQFIEFIEASIKQSGQNSEIRARALRSAFHEIIHDLATDTFEGDEEQKETLVKVLRNIPEWNKVYEQFKREEEETFLATEMSIEVEILKDDQVLRSFPISTDTVPLQSVTPGRYMVRLSNGRILWEGELTKEDLIWAFAFPEGGLQMAATTDTHQRKSTRTIMLLDGEIILHVFAGIEGGEIRIEYENRI